MTDDPTKACPDPALDSAREEARWLHKPRFAEEWEDRLGQRLAPFPYLFTIVKLVSLAPLLLAGLDRAPTLIEGRPVGVVVLYLVYVLCDYLIELGQRARGETPQGRSARAILDRATDYPLPLILAYLCLGILPGYLIGLKVSIDLILLVLFLIGRGSGRNRLRAGVNYATLLALLLVYEGLSKKHVTPELAAMILALDIAFLAVVALYNLNVLQKRFIADALSGANLLCGVFSIYCSHQGRFELSLLFLMAGAAFDGFDGAAARRWGGTSWGVYSDDVADAVNYGIAPGAALWFALPGLEGWTLGPFYSLFTISRLVFFTLNKEESDPNYFSGVPSTLGGIMTLCSLILFLDHPALVGLLVGVACTLMVSFDTRYRHLGRALSKHKRAFFGMPFLLVLLLGGAKLLGPEAPAALILLAALGYGLKPFAASMARLIGKRAHSRLDQTDRS